MNAPLVSLARQFHRVPLFRRWARRIAAGRSVSQPFHGGVICLDAVEHSWAWTGHRRLQDFERPVQDRLLALIATRPALLDVGCSIGVMTLSVLLRAPQVRSVSIDASPRAIQLLERSLRRNRLQARAQTAAVAVSAGEPTLSFAKGSSFTGHVSADGEVVPALPLATLVARHVSGPTVIKLDLEGYEARLAESLRALPALRGSVLAIELHPRGFNGFGDPFAVIRALEARGDLQLSLIGGGALSSLDPTQFNQLEAQWPA